LADAILISRDEPTDDPAWIATGNALEDLLDDYNAISPWDVMPEKAAPPWNPKKPTTLEELSELIKLSEAVAPEGIAFNIKVPQSVIIDEDVQAALDDAAEIDELNSIRYVLKNRTDELLWPPGLTVSESVARLVKILKVERGISEVQGWKKDADDDCFRSKKIERSNEEIDEQIWGIVEKTRGGRLGLADKR